MRLGTVQIPGLLGFVRHAALALLLPALLASLDSFSASAEEAAPPVLADSSIGAAGSNLQTATPVAPVIRWQALSNFAVTDEPNDNGHALHVRWNLSPDDAQILGYEIFRLPSPSAPESEWIQAGSSPRGNNEFVYIAGDASHDGKPNPLYIATGVPVAVAVRAIGADGSVSPMTTPATGVARGNWFHTGKLTLLFFTLFFAISVVSLIQAAKKGKPLYIRPIGGINAVDEAIGRATEMGRPILFVLGTGTAGDIATIAGFTILSRVAKRTAEYQTPILVPVNDPVVMAMAQETVKEAYVQAGRPDVYRPETVYYISAMQFPYVAAVNGLMLRERTATNFYMGVFHAESLLLAEAGSTTGAIQISGTDQVSQIPFFVAATDYTLIGEELYAASAYLSQEPAQMGPLKAQDWSKLLILAFIVISVLLWTFFGMQGLAHLARTA